MTAGDVQRGSFQYPGGLAARYRWAGTGQGEAVFAMSEAGGSLAHHGGLGSDAPERACRAELRVEGPLGAWTVRLASPIFDEPQGLLRDAAGLLVVWSTGSSPTGWSGGPASCAGTWRAGPPSWPCSDRRGSTTCWSRARSRRSPCGPMAASHGGRPTTKS